MSSDAPSPIGWFAAPPFSPRVDEATLNPAKWMYERLVRSVIAFERNLDASREIGLRLIQFGPGETLAIEDIGFWGPDLIRFYGRNADGHPVELLQHMSQVNMALVAVPATGEPRRIGFVLEQHLKEAGEQSEKG